MPAGLRPQSDEYAPGFAGYVARIAEDEDIVAALHTQLDEALQRLHAIPAARSGTHHAPGKWTLKEVIGHLSDTERVFAYRALRIARGAPGRIRPPGRSASDRPRPASLRRRPDPLPPVTRR